jgi:hypothetical protein
MTDDRLKINYTEKLIQSKSLDEFRGMGGKRIAKMPYYEASQVKGQDQLYFDYIRADTDVRWLGKAIGQGRIYIRQVNFDLYLQRIVDSKK